MVTVMKKLVCVTVTLVGQEITASTWGARLLALLMVCVTTNKSFVSVTTDSLVSECVCACGAW